MHFVISYLKKKTASIVCVPLRRRLNHLFGEEREKGERGGRGEREREREGMMYGVGDEYQLVVV